MPSVWPEKKGNRWVLKWKDPATGKGRSHSPKVPLLSKAAAKAASALFAKKLPDPIRKSRLSRMSGDRPDDQVTIAQICDTWLTTETRPGLAYAAEAASIVKRAAEKMGWKLPADVTRASLLAWNAGSDKTKSYCRTVFIWAQSVLKQPFDPDALLGLKGLQSIESEWDLPTTEEFQSTMEKARSLGQEHMAHCIARYGWRGVTLCRIKGSDWDFTTTPATVRLDVKRTKSAARKKKPHVHPLFPDTVALLRPIVAAVIAKHGPDARTFRNCKGDPWHCDVRAIGIRRWYNKHVRPLAPTRGGFYAWKRWALTAMEEGRAPWPRPLTDREIMLFTGHTTTSQVKRYKRSNRERAASLVSGGESGANRATGLLTVQHDTTQTDIDTGVDHVSID